MRLLITTDTIGGVWTFTQELCAELLERGCAVLLVSFGRMPAPAQQEQCDQLMQRFGRRFEFVPTAIPLEWMEANERAYPEGARVLEREVTRFAPDLIHSNQFCYGALDVAVPRVVTAHSDVLSWARECGKAPLEPSAWLDSYVSQVQAGLLRADVVTAPTRWMLDALSTFFEVPAPVEVVPNGRSLSRAEERPRLLRAVTAGRLWDEAKGVTILADVPSPMPVLVAGELHDGAPQTFARNGVELMGQLSSEQMEELLRSNSVYLCLSKYEPFGLAALEAAQCGCAVIARDIPPLREVWGTDALYFADAPSLTAAMHSLANDPRELAHWRTRAAGRAQLYTVGRMVDRYMGIYGRTLVQSEMAEHVA